MRQKKSKSSGVNRRLGSKYNGHNYSFNKVDSEWKTRRRKEDDNLRTKRGEVLA